MHNSKKAYSLIEILVVLGVFAVLATLSTQAVLQTIKSSRKSEASIRVRENLSYSVSVMERALRSATSVSCPSTSRIDYRDPLGGVSYFSYNTSGSDMFIASGSATIRLTNNQVIVTAATFTCNPPSPVAPTSVTIGLTGTDATTTGVESVSSSVSTQIFFRQGN